MCLRAHETTVLSPQTCHKILNANPNMDYKQKCCDLELLPLNKHLLLNKCVLMQKIVHGKAPQYLKDHTIPSERFTFIGVNNFCPEQGLISLKRVFPFQAL